MKIAQISTVSAPVNADSWGSVEALVWLLSRELVRLGHEVTVFAIQGSESPGHLVATLPGPYGAPGVMDDWHICEWTHLGCALEQAREFDVLHSHAYLWGIPIQSACPRPMVHTLHIVPDDNSAQLRLRWPHACVTAVSHAQWSSYPHLPPAAVIPHGIDHDQFPFRAKAEDYLCYLGRFVSGKGPLHAIDTARRLGLPLRLAGPENAYFREQIQPLVDGRHVEYVGCLRGPQRSEFLGKARALLYPIQYPESFGLVLAEAMLCGTPVAAVSLGAVPEIVPDGVGGCLAKSMNEFPEAARKACGLDRATVHAYAARQFNPASMAGAYLRVFEQAAQKFGGTP